MKSKHVFLCEPEVHPSMRVYFVPIGTSQRDKRIKSRLQHYAAGSPDVFFSVYDDNVVTFLQNLAVQLYDNLSPRHAWEKFSTCNVRVVSSSQILNLC